MRIYCHKTRWLLNCLWKTWLIRQQDKELTKSLSDVYNPYKNLKDRSRFPRTLPFKYTGEDFFIHAYWIKHISQAYKSCISARLVKSVNIICPEIPMVLLHRVTNRCCVVQFQKEIDCKPIKCWSVGMGRQLAEELKKWHGVSQDQLAKIRFPCSLNHTSVMARAMEAVLWSPYLDHLEGFSHGIVHKACAYLKETTLIGPFALCHGDIHRGNLLRNAQGQFAWLDLDTVDCLPIFQELAWVQFFVLGNYSDAAEALDKRYFEGAPQLRDLWYRFRLHWCVIQSIYHLARSLRVGSCLPGHSPTIFRHYERTIKSANNALQKAIRAQNLIEGCGDVRRENLGDILAYLNKKPRAILPSAGLGS